MTHHSSFPHEKLAVYHRSMAFEALAEEIIAACSQPHAFTDHLYRAAEGVVDSLVCGNSKWSPDAKCRYFGIAYGSALECAGCLDIGQTKGSVTAEHCCGGKEELQHIVRMLFGLIRSQQAGLEVREPDGEYQCETANHTAECYFDHERLHVYQGALGFVGWAEDLIRERDVPSRFGKRLDLLSTSVVLNIAEGNGRFGRKDHRCFVETAYLSALKAAALLDRMSGKEVIDSDRCDRGKSVLDEIARMLFGMRRYLDDTCP